MSEKDTKRIKLLLYINLTLAAAILIVVSLLGMRWWKESNRPKLAEITIPNWIEADLLQQNRYSRPGTLRSKVDDIVVHYVANPGTTAKQNRNYFNGLAEQSQGKAISASSHFIIGIDGTIIQCIPLEEIAYANYPRNVDTISIECCHPDETGEFSEATKQSLVRLTAWLCQELNLKERNVIRHYDVIGKDCPKYYVTNEDAWYKLKQEIKKKRKES